MRPILCRLPVLVAIAVLIGWAGDIELLKTILPGLTTMKANTASGLLAIGLGLDALGPSAARPGGARGGIALATGGFTAALGLATLAEYAFGVSLGIDQLLVADPATTSAPYNGRMSPATAIGFVGLGAATVLLTREGGRAVPAAHVAALPAAALGALSLTGYAYGVERLYNFGPYVSVALNTAACLCALAFAALLTRADEGWRRPFVGRPVARAVLVRLLPWSILFPFVSGLLVLEGVRIGYYDALFAPALLAVVATASFVWLAFAAAAGARRAEEALEVSERQFRQLSEAMPNHVWVGAPDGRLTWFNRQVYAYSGATEAALLGAGWTNLVHPDDLAQAARSWTAALGSGASYETEFRIRGADGAYRWFLVRGEPIRAADGTIMQWVGTNTDTHEQRSLRSDLEGLNATLERQVGARTKALMVAEEQLRQSQKMEAVGQLTGGLAHDFNNLLAGISGSLELMQARISQGRLKDIDKYMVAAQGAAKRAAALTHRLLAFSRRQTLTPKATNVNKLVAGMLDLVQRTVGPDVAVQHVGASGLWPALADPSQLENALLNLCINARDAMPGGGKITVETANRWLDRDQAKAQDMPEGQYLSLCVSDTGTGMPPEVVAKAFDPFFTTKPLGEGTGLGLSMIYGFARQSGGQVRIYSEVGQGTTVCIYLPRYLGDADADEVYPTLAPTQSAEAGETVLVVDDEPTVRMLVSDVLEDAGYTAIEASDGAGGLRVLQSDARIDLLVTDVGLPGGMNGRQMADAARSNRPNLKVLFITGFAENALLNNGQLEPGMQVLTKPFAVDTLAARIREMIAR